MDSHMCDEDLLEYRNETHSKFLSLIYNKNIFNDVVEKRITQKKYGIYRISSTKSIFIQLNSERTFC